MISKEDVLAAFRFRHACKQFDAEKKISAEDFGFILETGRLSPSSFGIEPWRFVVVQNPGLRTRLKEVTWGAQGTLPTASHFVAILCRKNDMRHDSAFVADFMARVQKHPADRIAKRTEVLRNFQENDFRLLDSPTSLFDWACKQGYIALGNMMSAAAMIGIDSCPIEGFDRQAAEAVLADAGALERDKFGLAVMVAFGYRVNPQPDKTRQPMEEVVAWVN